MGYACPVCGTPQADGEHLANHLAFTAMLRSDDHEAWLDEHAPGWSECDPATLAERVVDHADEREFPQVFEDTTGDADGAGDAMDAGHAHDIGDDVPPAVSNADAPDERAVPSDVLSEARELTRARREDEDGNADGDAEGDDGRDTGSDGAD